MCVCDGNGVRVCWVCVWVWSLRGSGCGRAAGEGERGRESEVGGKHVDSGRAREGEREREQSSVSEVSGNSAPSLSPSLALTSLPVSEHR